MGESEALSVRLDDACREGLGEAGLVTGADDGLHEGHRRIGERRNGGGDIESLGSERVEAHVQQLVEGGRDGEILAGLERAASALKGGSELSAKSGFPPDASQSLISIGRANVASRRLCNSSCVAPRLRPRTRTVRSRFSSTARLTHSGTSSRTASTVATRSWRSRATAYPIADSEAASSHWRSSTARQRGRSAASRRRAPRKAAATERGSAPSSESASSNAASRASRWIGGSSGKTSPTTSSSMSVSARNEKPASAGVGAKTRPEIHGRLQARELRATAPSCRSRPRR